VRVLRFLGYPIQNFSSLEHMVLSHCEQLNLTGHHAECVYDGIWNQEAADRAIAFAPNTKIHFDFPFGLGFKPFDRLAYYRKALNLIRDGRFDVVDAYFEPSSKVLNQVAKACPHTVFVNTMGNPLHQRSRFRLVRALKRKYAIYNRKHFDGIVAVSEFVRDDLLATGLPGDRMTVIRNCVDVEKFKPTGSKRFEDGRINVTFTGRLVEQKNLEVLIRASRLLFGRPGFTNLKVTIYGEGHLRPSLESLVKELGIENVVSLPGHVHDVVDLLNNRTDIYCHPSNFEGLSASLLEAMACECPIVASSIPSNREAIKHGETGLLFETSDPTDLADKLEILATSEQLRETVSRNARKFVVSELTLDQLIKRTNEFYQSLLEKKQISVG
jgi:glycosyltransferase involved in cell wall biosynthesis